MVLGSVTGVVVPALVFATSKEVAQILCVWIRGSTQKRLNVEDFLQGLQCGTVVVVDEIFKRTLASAFGNPRSGIKKSTMN